MKRGHRAGLPRLIALTIVAISLANQAPLVTLAHAEDEAALQKYLPTGRHRIDLSYTRYDSFVGDVYVFLPSYTWAPRRNMRLNITGSYVSNDNPAIPGLGIPETQERGFGDTQFGVQYDPSESLTASPWVPDTLGLNATLIAPTGDADKGLGSDTWFVRVGAGWPLDSVSHLWLVPAVGYETTFAEGAHANPSEKLDASIDFMWWFESGAWIAAAPRIGYEFETREWVDDFTITIGKMFDSGFGLSFDYGSIEQINPNAFRDDESLLVNFYYQFGRPPGE